jgi:hypothetical protein
MRDTSGVGEIARMQVMAAVARLGKTLLTPFGDFSRYDFVFEDETGRFFRVQCKIGRLRKGAVTFFPSSVDSRTEQGHCIRRPYTHEVEYLGVYCPDNNKVYLIPVAEVTNGQCSLRVEPPRNGQKTHIRWAHDYEIGEGVKGVWVTQTVKGSETEVFISDPFDSP